MMSTATAHPGPVMGSFRAWWHLLTISMRRQFWTVQTLVACLLLLLLALLVGIQSYWGWSLEGFTEAIILNIYISFLLPILCLCFGTQTMGGDWEERSLVWLLTRPLPRPLIYTAKLVATMPWTFGLTLGGLALLGLLAGASGQAAVYLFWPAVAWATLAYLSLFALLGAWFRRSTVIAVVYAFVIETIIGNMPGLVKRSSIGYYARCLVYDLGIPGIEPDRQSLFLPVDGTTALRVLTLATLGFILLGIMVFSRREYHNLT
jgi:ABC-type transport system involved in multi-copper enzyme maturation permease subunit